MYTSSLLTSKCLRYLPQCRYRHSTNPTLTTVHLSVHVSVVFGNQSACFLLHLSLSLWLFFSSFVSCFTPSVNFPALIKSTPIKPLPLQPCSADHSILTPASATFPSSTDGRTQTDRLVGANKAFQILLKCVKTKRQLGIAPGKDAQILIVVLAAY